MNKKLKLQIGAILIGLGLGTIFNSGLVAGGAVIILLVIAILIGNIFIK